MMGMSLVWQVFGHKPNATITSNRSDHNYKQQSEKNHSRQPPNCNSELEMLGFLRATISPTWLKFQHNGSQNGYRTLSLTVQGE